MEGVFVAELQKFRFGYPQAGVTIASGNPFLPIAKARGILELFDEGIGIRVRRTPGTLWVAKRPGAGPFIGPARCIS